MNTQGAAGGHGDSNPFHREQLVRALPGSGLGGEVASGKAGTQPSSLQGKKALTWLPQAWGRQGLEIGPSLGCPGPSVRKWEYLCSVRGRISVASPFLLPFYTFRGPRALVLFPLQTASPYQRGPPNLTSTHGA